MPFDFHKYDHKCSTMTTHELQHEWEHYTRLIASAATSTSVSSIALPFTAGISGIGIAISAPAIHNARKKRDIIDKHLARLGSMHDTRKRDVLAPMALSSTVGLLTMGIGHAGGGAISNAAMEHGWTAVAAHEGIVKVSSDVAVHGVAVVGEEEHMKKKKEKEAVRKAATLALIPVDAGDVNDVKTDGEMVSDVKVNDTKVSDIKVKPAAVQSIMNMGLKPAVMEIPAMGLSHSVPSTPMEPAPAYTLFAEAAQTGYFPAVSSDQKPIPVTDLDYKPPVERPPLPPRTRFPLDVKVRVNVVEEEVLETRT